MDFPSPTQEFDQEFAQELAQGSAPKPRRVNALAPWFVGLVFLLPLLSAGCMKSGPVDAPGKPDPATERLLPAGKIIGFADDSGGHTWRGIPFAQPPVGELRWRAPRALEPWNGTHQALELGSACLQPATPMMRSVEAGLSEPIGSEDCLFLNVHAPRTAAQAAPLPVMVWIHGGANAYGEGGAWDLAEFAVSQDLVVVSLNYRLGILGWFHEPALWNDGDSALDRSGNYGTLDLVRGLEWIRDNIASFSGDPNNVTIFGSSAGGSNTSALMLTPQSRGLFHRAIAMSGGVWSTPVAPMHAWREDDGAHWSSPELLAALRIADERSADRDAAKADVDALGPAEVETALRGATADQLLEILPATEWANIRASIRDGHVLPESPLIAAYAAGEFHRLPFITGSCRDESKFFAMLNPKQIWQYLSDEPKYHRDTRYDSDRWKALAVDEIAVAMGKAGHSDVWAYRFDWDDMPNKYGFNLHQFLGAFHGVLGPILLGPTAPNASLIDSDTNAADVAVLRDQSRSYWSEFAYRGRPGTGRSGEHPHWKRWSSEPGRERLLLFDAPADGGTRMSTDFGTIAMLIERLAADERFDSSERCEVYEQLARQARMSGEAAPPLAACPPAASLEPGNPND